MALVWGPGKLGRPLGLSRRPMTAPCHGCRGKVAMGTATQRANYENNTASVSIERAFCWKDEISIYIDGTLVPRERSLTCHY